MGRPDTIKLELYPEVAPNSVNNFISLINRKFYDGLIFIRSVGIAVGRSLGDAVHHIHSFDYFAESRVLPVQMRGGFVHDEELGACGIGVHGPCHGQHACRML